MGDGDTMLVDHDAVCRRNKNNRKNLPVKTQQESIIKALYKKRASENSEALFVSTKRRLKKYHKPQTNIKPFSFYII